VKVTFSIIAKPLTTARRARLCARTAPKKGHLFAAVSDHPPFASQPPTEVLAESAASFFYKSVDAQITFETDRNGKVRRLAMHLSGNDISARPLE
jgi:hypothetical protein